MSEIVLDIEALTRRFGAFTAVDTLTLSVNAGEVFSLLGSNGAGKTTTIKMLTTLLRPASGEARVAGFSITTQAVDVRRSIGYVPQAVWVDGSLIDNADDRVPASETVSERPVLTARASLFSRTSKRQNQGTCPSGPPSSLSIPWARIAGRVRPCHLCTTVPSIAIRNVVGTSLTPS